MIMHAIASFLIVVYCSVFTAAYNCSKNCAVPEANNTDSCDILTGACSFGCKQGFAGHNCSLACPEKCVHADGFTTETCNISTGACHHGCQYGFTGTNCSILCPENCDGPPDGNNGVVCDAISRTCFFGCKSGYYGPNCTQLCNAQISNCNTCNQVNSTSDVVCTECNCCGLYLNNNVCRQCPYWCASGYTRQVCNKENGECTEGCKRGRYGPYCEKNCNPTCKDNKCDVNSGTCYGCDPSNYCGATCQVTCSQTCLQRSCHQNCTCSQGCQTNTWGEQCDKMCSTNCQKTTDTNLNVCDRKDGTCTHGCVNNTLWGSNCSSVCSQNCLNGTCERWSGNCVDGCTNNKVYGIGCDRECPSNCINNSCRRQDSFCEEGCISGWYGAQCDHRCSVHCIGDSCERLAGSCNCGTGRFGKKCEFQCQETCVNNVCHSLSGICTYGCLNGYDGEKCEKDSIGVPYIAIGEGVLFLMMVAVIIYLVRKSDGCKGVGSKTQRRSDIRKNVLQGNRDTNTNVYTDLNRTNDAEGTTGPYDSLDMKTSAATEVSTSNPENTVKKTSSSYELM